MTLEIGFLFALLAAMIVLFITEKWSVDLVGFAGLLVLILAGYIKPEEAFTGFSSPAVITMLSVLFLSAALQTTGVARALADRIRQVVGPREVPLIITIMLVAGVLSAFMNNIAAVAVLMPAVMSLGRRTGIPAARLMIPLAYGAILGGTTTLVGTPPNLLTAQVLIEHDLKPFGLFDFTPFGLALLGAGVLFMITLGRRLLPAATPGMATATRSDLATIYRLEERLFSRRFRAGSPLIGRSLEEAQLARTLGVQVVAIVRSGGERLAPGAQEVLRAGDHLVVKGRRDDLEQRLAFGELQLADLEPVTLTGDSDAVGGLVVRLREQSPLAGRTLRELDLRNQRQVVVAGAWRAGTRIEEPLPDQTLEAGDELLLLGEAPAIDALAARADLEVVLEGRESLERLDGHIFALTVPAGSRLAGTTIGDTRLREQLGLSVIGVTRDGSARLFVSPQLVLQAGDRLLVTGQPGPILRLLAVGQVGVDEHEAHRPLESEEVGLVEAVVAPRSAAQGRTLRELAFRKRFGLHALAIWRGGQPIRTGVADLALRLGDGLLLQGPREKALLLESDPDFVMLAGRGDRAPRRPGRAPFALAALLLMVLLVASGWFPIQVAAFAAAVMVVLSGALTMQEAYRAVEWRAVFLVAALLPVGLAMERTGAAQLLAGQVAHLAGDAGPQAILAALMLLASLLSQGLGGAPTVVLMGPVVMDVAVRLNLSPYPLMMGVGLAAAAAFMTPYSHGANLLVMGAGGYRARDYIRVGAPLTAAMLALMVALIPLLIPFGR